MALYGFQHDQRLVGNPGRAPIVAPPHHPPRPLQSENLAHRHTPSRRAAVLAEPSRRVRVSVQPRPNSHGGIPVLTWYRIWGKTRHSGSAQIIGLMCRCIWLHFSCCLTPVRALAPPAPLLYNPSPCLSHPTICDRACKNAHHRSSDPAPCRCVFSLVVCSWALAVPS